MDEEIEEEMDEEFETITLILMCPECGYQFEWTGDDFEEWINCPKCDYGSEAWNFWHTIKDHRFKEAKEVWTLGAHYCNDALYYSLDEFLNEFFGKVGPVHGSDYYIWIYVYEFPSGDEYFIAKISYDLISPFAKRECFDEIKNLLLKFERNRPPKQGSKK
jgi:hypothetical protein